MMNHCAFVVGLLIVMGVCVCVCVCVCDFADAEPSIDYLLDQEKVALWLSWLMRYYPKGNTVRNKCQHASSFLKHLKALKGYGDDAGIRCKISQCRDIIKQQAQDGKIKGIKQRAELENEDELLSKGTLYLSNPYFGAHLSLTISVVYVNVQARP